MCLSATSETRENLSLFKSHKPVVKRGFNQLYIKKKKKKPLPPLKEHSWAVPFFMGNHSQQGQPNGELLYLLFSPASGLEAPTSKFFAQCKLNTDRCTNHNSYSYVLTIVTTIVSHCLKANRAAFSSMLTSQ